MRGPPVRLSSLPSWAALTQTAPYQLAQSFVAAPAFDDTYTDLKQVPDT